MSNRIVRDFDNDLPDVMDVLQNVTDERPREAIRMLKRVVMDLAIAMSELHLEAKRQHLPPEGEVE